MSVKVGEGIVSMKEEQLLKIKLYEYLIEVKTDDFILASEVVVGNVRADVMACSKEKIHIYEIKSKNDTLYRLKNQIKTYKKYANLITLVIDEKFLDQINNIEYLSDIGILKFKNNTIKEIRKPKQKSIKKENYFTYWSPIEIKKSLVGFSGWYKLDTVKAYKKLVNVLKKDEVIKLTMNIIQEKYGNEFLKIKNKITNGDIDRLPNRFKTNMPNLNIVPIKDSISRFRDIDSL